MLLLQMTPSLIIFLGNVASVPVHSLYVPASAARMHALCELARGEAVAPSSAACCSGRLLQRLPTLSFSYHGTIAIVFVDM